MNWQAIGIGAAVGIVIGLVWNLAVTALMGSDPAAWSWLHWIGYLVGILGDIAVGATAGWLAARRGAAHGALADTAAIVGSFVVGAVLQLARHHGLEYLGHSEYWLGTDTYPGYLVQVLPGIAIAALAGWPAALLAATRRARPGAA